MNCEAVKGSFPIEFYPSSEEMSQVREPLMPMAGEEYRPINQTGYDILPWPGLRARIKKGKLGKSKLLHQESLLKAMGSSLIAMASTLVAMASMSMSGEAGTHVAVIQARIIKPFQGVIVGKRLARFWSPGQDISQETAGSYVKAQRLALGMLLSLGN